MFTTVVSGYGFWNFFSWLAFFSCIAALVLWFRSQGRKDYKEDSLQDEIFYGGNPVPRDGAEIMVPASSAYWGFKKALHGFYALLDSWHSGVATDYVAWFALTVAIFALLLVF